MVNLVAITVRATDDSSWEVIRARAARAGAEAAAAFNEAYRLRADTSGGRAGAPGGLIGGDAELLNRLRAYAATPGGIGLIGTGTDTSLLSMLKNRVRAMGPLDVLFRHSDAVNAAAGLVREKVDDTGAVAELDRLRAKLDELGRRVAHPEVKVEGAARAEAELAAVNRELDKTRRKADEAGPSGLLGRILSGISGGGGAAGGGGSFLASPAGIGAIAVGVAALLPEVAGLVSGFAAAAAGAGAFYVLAHPAISQLTQDVQKLQTAQEALQTAQNKYAVDPTKANAKALQTAADNLKAVQMGMSQDAGGAAAGIMKLRQEYDKLTTAFAPDVFKVFNAGLKLAGELLPDLLPFARTFADVADRLLGQASRFAASKGFADWLQQFHGLEGPALSAIGKGLGEVIVQIGKLLTMMSAKDVVNAINIAFTVLSDTLIALRYVIESVMISWDVTSKTVARDARRVATEFDSLRHDIAQWAGDVRNDFDQVRQWIAQTFDRIRHDIAQWVSDVRHDTDLVTGWFRELPGRILHALGNLGHLLFQAGVDLVAGFIRGIESMFGAVARAALGLVESLGKKVLHVLGIGSPSKVAHWWGEMVARGFAGGIGDYMQLAADAAALMAGQVTAGLGPAGAYAAAAYASGGGWGLRATPAAGGGAGVQGIHVTLELGPNLIRATGLTREQLADIRHTVRTVGGGDVQTTFGRG